MALSYFNIVAFFAIGILAAAMDSDMAARPATDFAHDLQLSRCVDLREWPARSVTERLLALAGILIERYQ